MVQSLCVPGVLALLLSGERAVFAQQVHERSRRFASAVKRLSTSKALRTERMAPYLTMNTMADSAVAT